jgi:ABC-2 type transport system permease protein
MTVMRQVQIIAKRELGAYFTTPLAFVFIAIFVAMTGAFTFYIGRFFDRNQASLEAFFSFHPWLYLLLIPAVSMRLWADERKSGTIEQLLTLPITTTDAVLGKFLAAWAFCGIALVLTFPMWLTVNALGTPDNGVIVIGYLGSFLMAGSFLSIGICMSALTRNQIIAFIAAAVVCFLFTMSGLDLVLNAFRAWAPDALVDAIASFSFLTRFEAISRGVIEARDLVFFVSLMGFWLFATVVAVESKKSG